MFTLLAIDQCETTLLPTYLFNDNDNILSNIIISHFNY